MSRPEVPPVPRSLRGHASALFRRLVPSRLPLRGPFPSHAAAQAHAAGYDAPVVVGQVWHAIVEVLEGRAAYERDGLAFPSRPELPIHGALRALIGPDTTIADFGGGLGGLFINAPELFPSGCRRLVIEQASMVAAGRRLALDHSLHIDFQESGQSALPPVDVLVMSSVLSYIPDPWDQIAALLHSTSPNAVILDRTAVQDGPSRWYLQTNPGYYREPVTFPVQVLNRQRLLRAFPRFRRVRVWHNAFDPDRPEHIGILLLHEERAKVGE